MPRKSRKKNPNTIREQYNKAYRNYLARVNRQVRVGYNVDVIQRVKNPTRASIRRLEQQTAKTIKEHSTLYSMVTGEEVTHNRKSAERINREFSSLSPVEQALSQEKGTLVKGVQVSEEAVNGADMLISQWYEFIEKSFKPQTAQYIKEKTDWLVNKDRHAFATVLYKNPDILPEAGDSDRRVIDAKFSEMYNALNMYMDNPAYMSNFMDNVTGIVERED